MSPDKRPSFISRAVPETLRKPFPVYASSLEDFSSRIKEEGVTEVDARAGRAFKGGVVPVQFRSLGKLGTVTLSSEISARTRTGRKLILREILYEGFGSELKTIDTLEHLREDLMFYTVYERARRLREANPQLVVNFHGTSGEQMEEEEVRDKALPAMRMGLTPYSERVERRRLLRRLKAAIPEDLKI